MAGKSRGRPIAAPRGVDVRPTSDRVREATFNALVSLGAVAGAQVLDLFAGSGAMGIEALSRGAERCTFVDHSVAARQAVNANLEKLALTGAASVSADDAWSFLARSHSASPSTFDLVLLDPPYAFDRWAELTAAVLSRASPQAVLVVESDREVPCEPAWNVLRAKRYGGTVVQISRLALPAGTAPPPPPGAPA